MKKIHFNYLFTIHFLDYNWCYADVDTDYIKMFCATAFESVNGHWEFLKMHNGKKAYILKHTFDSYPLEKRYLYSELAEPC